MKWTTHTSTYMCAHTHSSLLLSLSLTNSMVARASSAELCPFSEFWMTRLGTYTQLCWPACRQLSSPCDRQDSQLSSPCDRQDSQLSSPWDRQDSQLSSPCDRQDSQLSSPWDRQDSQLSSPWDRQDSQLSSPWDRQDSKYHARRLIPISSSLTMLMWQSVWENADSTHWETDSYIMSTYNVDVWNVWENVDSTCWETDSYIISAYNVDVWSVWENEMNISQVQLNKCLSVTFEDSCDIAVIRSHGSDRNKVHIALAAP